MPLTNTTPPVASPPDPAQDHPVPTLPANIASLLHAVRILLGYGRHLVSTVRGRAAAPNFSAIAACFGTANLPTILAHLNRGILRAVALEKILLARAATGQDIDFVQPRTRTPPPAPAPPATEPEHLTPEPLPIRTCAPHPAQPTGSGAPDLFLPTLEAVERQVRRHNIGRTMLEICLDLGVVPGFCQSAFWNELFELITWFGSNVGKLMNEKTRRRAAFDKEQDRTRNASWDWINMPRDALRQTLGFFIGEPPTNPLDPVPP
jgi:hypothetical protein